MKGTLLIRITGIAECKKTYDSTNYKKSTIATLE